MLGLCTRNVRTFFSKCIYFLRKMLGLFSQNVPANLEAFRRNVLNNMFYYVLNIWLSLYFDVILLFINSGSHKDLNVKTSLNPAFNHFFPPPICWFILNSDFFNTLLKNMNTILRKETTPDRTTPPSEAASILGLGGAFSGADFTAFFATDKSYCLFY